MESTEDFRYCKRQRTDHIENEAIFTNLRKPPSLQDITLVSIAIKLWECLDVDTPIIYYYFTYPMLILRRQKKNEEKYKIYKNLSLLILPDSLKLKIANIIEPIGGEYCRFLKGEFEDSKGLCCWTMEGTIDYIKQFKEILKTSEFTYVEECRRLYHLACQHCLEDIIPDLELKASVTKDNLISLRLIPYDCHFILYWYYLTKNELHRLLEVLVENDNRRIYDPDLSIYVNMVSLSIVSGNSDALKYFWRKLREEEIITHIEKWTELSITILKSEPGFLPGYYVETDIMCFLLSNLTSHTKQMQFIKADAEIILLSLFHGWPHRNFFLPTITALLNFLQKTVYVSIMSKIVKELNEMKTTHLLLREVWNLSPLHLKKSFLSYLSSNRTALTLLLEIGDDLTFDMILNVASPSEKRNIFFKIVEEYDFYNFLRYSKLTEAIVIIERCASKHLLLDSDLFSFKRSIALKYAEELCLHWMSEGRYQATEELLNWVFQSDYDIQEFKKNHINPIRIYRALIHSADYNPVDYFLKWYFETEDDILNFKRKNVHEMKCGECENFLIELCEKGGDGWDQFQKFLGLRFDCSEEIEEFKKIYLDCIVSFLQKEHFEFASFFLNWCFDSSDEVNRYKKKLLLSGKGIDIFLHDVDDWNSELPESKKYTLEWFTPLTNEVILKFKTSLSEVSFCRDILEYDCDEEEERRRAFCALLETLISF